MAVIFEASDIRDGAKRALKVMSTTLEDPEVIHRFSQEFRTLSRLEHPNVLRVYECGVHHGRPYFTMERLEGVTLKEEIQNWIWAIINLKTKIGSR